MSRPADKRSAEEDGDADDRRQAKKAKGAAASAASAVETIQLPDGGRYVGQINGQGEQHGHGTNFRVDGTEEASGEWRNGKLHGHGKQTYPDGGRSEGEFVAGKMNGLGKYTSPDGHVYEGELRENAYNGFGIQWTAAGVICKGSCGRWEKGQCVEPGPVPRSLIPVGTHLSAAALSEPVERTLLLLGGNHYVGDIGRFYLRGCGLQSRMEDKMHVAHGYGVEYRADGVKIADGDWSHGKQHGDGWRQMPNGDRYEGNFCVGLFSQQGKMQHDNGDKYDGHFASGRRNGVGTLTRVDGSVFKGVFKKGERMGLGVQWDKDGRMEACGRWEKDKLVDRGPVPLSHLKGGVIHNAAANDAALLFPDGRFYRGDLNRKFQQHGAGSMHWADGAVQQRGQWRKNVFCSIAAAAEAAPAAPAASAPVAAAAPAAAAAAPVAAPGASAAAASPHRIPWLGDVYEGELNAQQQPHGQGVLIRLDGTERARGQWRNGKQHGRGQQILLHGHRFEGNFVDDKYSGLGAYTWADGGVFEGEWADGKRTGFGMQWDKDGALKHCGHWADNVFHRRPVPRSKIPVGTRLSPAARALSAADRDHTRTLLLHDGGHFVGEFNADFRPHGQGVEFKADGSVAASGEWLGGLLHGRGKTARDGDRYEGDFVDGKYSGLGSLTEAVSDILYEGEFVGGKRSGFGISWSKAGKMILCGRWDDESVEPGPVPRSKIPNGKFLSAAANGTALLFLVLFPGGGFYCGELNAQFQRHGQGSMHSADGVRLEIGQWLNDVLQPGRKALLIGNNKYEAPPKPLKCCVNDATDMEKALTQLGFECTLLLDATRRKMNHEISKFIETLRPNDVVFLYFSGHGAELAGVTYLLPVNFGRGSLKHDAVPLNGVMQQLNRKNVNLLNIIVLDCCRSNRTDDTFRGDELSRGAGDDTLMEGTSSVRLPSKGQFFVAFSSDPGTVAHESSADRNGYFTGCLLPLLREPGLRLTEIFFRTNEQLEIKSSDRQRSWQNMSIKRDLVLFGPRL